MDKPITARRICPYCKKIIEPYLNVVICTACGTAHHFNCWHDSLHCATIGCPGTPRNEEIIDTLNPSNAELNKTLPSAFATPFEFPIPATVIIVTCLLMAYGIYGLGIVINDFNNISGMIHSDFIRKASLNEYICRMSAILPMIVIGCYLLKIKHWARIWAMRTLFFFYLWMLGNDIIYLLNRQDFIDHKVTQRWIDNVATSQSIQTVWVIVFLLIAMVIKAIITFTAIYHLASMQLINDFDYLTAQKELRMKHKENDEKQRIINEKENSELKSSDASITYVGFDEK